MTTIEALRYMAELWDHPKPVVKWTVPDPDSCFMCVTLDSYIAHGLCGTIVLMERLDMIDDEVFVELDNMISTASDDGGDGVYTWSRDRYGARKRAAWCRARAEELESVQPVR